MAKRKSIIPGFSWNRALGITSAKQKIARATGIPTTKQGQKRKLQSSLWTAIASALLPPRHPNRKHLRRRKQSGARKFGRADAGLAAIF